MPNLAKVPGQPIARVLRPGLLTTIQDLGRAGHRRDGVAAGGAMDGYACRAANLLAGNPENSACLEIVLTGLSLEFLRPCTVAITGANLSAQVDGHPAPIWASFNLERNTILSFPHRQWGCRAYLSVCGGFWGKEVLGSRSTDLRNHWGGWDGRALRTGDILKIQSSPEDLGRFSARKTNPELLQTYDNQRSLRVILGPQTECFPPEAVRQFFEERYQIQSDSDRMGYRLQSSPLKTLIPEIISDPVPPGAIQVLPSGQLILLMNDSPTVGGYPKIAVLCRADLPKAAQLNIGDSIQFQSIQLEEAHQLLRSQEEGFREGIVGL
ncbi:MAG: biotin-dependent carboxyltransferase family protein [Terriglobia bacterium]